MFLDIFNLNLSHLTGEADFCFQISSFSKDPLVRDCISFSDLPGTSNPLWKELDHGYKYKETKIATFLVVEYNKLIQHRQNELNLWKLSHHIMI